MTLAKPYDVQSFLGRSLTPVEDGRVDAILAKLSALFVKESGQQFIEGMSVVRLKVNGGKVYLAQRPVVAVDSVTDDDGTTVPFTLFGQWLTVPRASHQFVRVAYSHGGEVPELVRSTIADAARQVLGIDKYAASGVSQQGTTTGPFSDQATYAGWAQGGSARLSPEDMAVARSFRVKVPTVWVLGR